MSEVVYTIATLDGETVQYLTSEAPGALPESWEEAKASIAAKIAKLEKENRLPCNIFASAELSVKLRSYFNQLEQEEKACIYAHLHPEHYAVSRWLFHKFADYVHNLEEPRAFMASIRGSEVTADFDKLGKLEQFDLFLDALEQGKTERYQDLSTAEQQEIKEHDYYNHLCNIWGDTLFNLLEEVTDIITQALGHHPKAFRGGRGSFNAEIGRILEKLGYEGTSTKFPEREAADTGSTAVGCVPYPHHWHPGNSLIAGDKQNHLKLVEVPLSVNRMAKVVVFTHSKGKPDLRPDTEFGVPCEDTVDGILQAQQKEKWGIKLIVGLTHNNIPFGDAEDPRTKRFTASLAVQKEAVQSMGYKPVGASIMQVVEIVRKMPLPPKIVDVGDMTAH